MSEKFADEQIALLKSLLNYDPITGLFTWRRDYRMRKAGDSAGSMHPTGYTYLKIKGQTYSAHRAAWLIMTGSWPALPIDHRDGQKSNNQWANLRTATHAQNGSNMPGRRASGMKGCYFHKSQKRWRANIRVNRNWIYLGSFDTEQEAHDAYLLAAEKYQGEFAYHLSRKTA